MKIIEQDTIDIIKAHINERPRYKLAQRMGVSVKFLYKILHDCNCKTNIKDLFRNPTRSVMNKLQSFTPTIQSKRLPRL